MQARLESPQPPAALFAAPVKLIVGVSFTVLGVALTLDNLGMIEAESILRFWPVVLIAIGITEMLRPGDSTAGAILTTVGVVLLIWANHWIRVSLFDLWPLLLIAGGCAVVVQALGWRPAVSGKEGSYHWALLSTRKITEQSQAYEGGRLVAMLGGCDLDLTQAKIATSPATLEVLALWGGIVIRVPAGWEVVGEAIPVMGGIEIRTGPASGGERLVVRGLTLMAGMEIKSEPARIQ